MPGEDSTESGASGWESNKVCIARRWGSLRHGCWVAAATLRNARGLRGRTCRYVPRHVIQVQIGRDTRAGSAWTIMIFRTCTQPVRSEVSYSMGAHDYSPVPFVLPFDSTNDATTVFGTFCAPVSSARPMISDTSRRSREFSFSFLFLFSCCRKWGRGGRRLEGFLARS